MSLFLAECRLIAVTFDTNAHDTDNDSEEDFVDGGVSLC